MKQEQRKKWLKRALIALVVAGLACIVSTCAAFVLTPSTVVVEVEVTASPTAIVAIPTNTPTPTATNTPTPTPPPTPMEDEQVLVYVLEAGPLVECYGEVFTALSIWMSSMEVGSRDDWEAVGILLCEEVLNVGVGVSELEAPDVLAEADLYLYKASKHLDAAASLILVFIETGDWDALDQMVVELDLGNLLLQRSTEEFNKYNESLN